MKKESGTGICSFLDEPFNYGRSEFVRGERNTHGKIDIVLATGFLASRCSETQNKHANITLMFSPTQSSVVLLESKFPQKM